MNIRTLLIVLLVVGLAVTGIILLNPIKQKNLIQSPVTQQEAGKPAQPSATSIDYADPSGFSLSYPDNLSLTKNDITDNNTYADIQLTSKDVSGSLNLKITDSKFTTIDDWLKLSKGVSKEVQLGSLKATEVTTADRLLLGALDKGIFFSIEMPLVEKDFWMKVYNKVLASFSFSAPQAATTDTSGSDISFEGEEVVQ